MRSPFEPDDDTAHRHRRESVSERTIRGATVHSVLFARLLTFPNVVVTAHQAFFTREALHAISETTLDNISAFEQGRRSGDELY